MVVALHKNLRIDSDADELFLTWNDFFHPKQFGVG